MPRQREYTVKENLPGGWQERAVEMKDGDVTKEVTYKVPADLKSFVSIVTSASEEILQSLYDSLVTGVDSKARAAEREAAMADSTEIMVNGKKIDIYNYPLAKLVSAINGFGQVWNLTGKEMPNAFRAAYRKLVTENKAKEAGDVFGTDESGKEYRIIVPVA